MLFLYIFGPIAVFILATFASVRIYRRRKKTREAAEKRAAKTAEFYDLLERAEKGDTQAQDALVDGKWRHEGHAENTARLEANKKLVEARRKQKEIQRDWERYGEPVKRAHAEWQKAVSTKEEPALFVAFVLAFGNASAFGRASGEETRGRLVEELGFDYEETKSRLQKVVLERYEMLVPKMLEDQESFLELRGLIPETRDKYGEYYYAGVKPLKYPAGWNKAVARFLENPAVEEFVERGDGPAPGQVLQWGEEALRDRDIVKAKLTLAYASKDHYWRLELGGVLNHMLGEFVAEYHASLAAKASAITEPSV